MTRAFTAMFGIWIAIVPVSAAPPTAPDWELKADYIDACSCDLACPCIFGGSPTRGYCKGASLVEIRAGHYGKVDLAGVTVLAVYEGGKWIKFLVGENATRAQTEAVVELLPAAEGFFEAPVREVKNQTISVKRDGDKVEISTEGTFIELRQVKNSAGEPIRVSGLPAHGFPGLPYHDHTQYRTIALSHDSGKEKFDFSETNGYTARIDASSDPAGE